MSQTGHTIFTVLYLDDFMKLLSSQSSYEAYVSGQIWPDQLQSLAQNDVSIIVNHRPDGEESGQPLAEDIFSHGLRFGIQVLHIPIVGIPNEHQVEATRQILNGSNITGKVLMFCRSGMRSAATWAMAQRLDGADADDLRQAAAAAGYDLSRLPL